MEFVHVLAAIETKQGEERFVYLDENECWTSDLQKAKVYPTEINDEVDQLEEQHEAMAWSVWQNENGSLQSLWDKE